MVAYEQVKNHNTKKVCMVLKLNRSSFYFCAKTRPEGKFKKENDILKREIIRIYNKNDGVYGAPKIRIELLKLNLSFKVSERRVSKIMRALGIKSVVIKKFRPCRSDAVYNGGENLLKRDFSTTTINQKWVSDITYIHTLANGWCYLASIMDLATNKIIGWHFSHNIDTTLVMNALNNAIITNSNLPEELIIHSDRGSQYTSHEYRNKIKQLNIKQSFSAKGCPYDNAPIESFHAILKKELVHRRVFKNFEQAKIEIFKYIESRYNRNRIHSALGYITPQQAENNFKNVA